MELAKHSTGELRDELERRSEAAKSRDRRKAVAQTLRAIAFALEDETIVVDGDRLQKAADKAYEIAWRGMPGGSCRETGYRDRRGTLHEDKAESGMDLGWARVLNFRWPTGISRFDTDKLLGEQRDAVLNIVRPGHGTTASRIY